MKKRLEKVAWFPVPEMGFDLCIRYISISEGQKMRERALTVRRNLKTGQMEEHLDEELYAREMAAIIVDWRGLTRDAYQRLIAIDPADYPEEIPCTLEYKLELLQEARGFATVVLDLCSDLARYQTQKLADEVKNS